MSRLVIKVMMILHITDPSKCRSDNSREKRYMKCYFLRFYSTDYSHIFSVKLSKERKIVIKVL